MRISAAGTFRSLVSILDRLLSAPTPLIEREAKDDEAAPANLDAVAYTAQTLAAFHRKIQAVQSAERAIAKRRITVKRPLTDAECDRSVAQLRAALHALQQSLAGQAMQGPDSHSSEQGPYPQPETGTPQLAQAS